MAYSLKEAREIMAATQEILNADARLGRRTKAHPPTVDARAAATKKPPSANDLYFNEILELMEEKNLSRAEAIRELAGEKPHLLQAFVAEHNKERLAREDRDRKAVARRHAHQRR